MMKDGGFMKEKKFSTPDVNLAAFLLFNGITPELEKLPTGKVIFYFPATDELYEVLERYNRNCSVPVGTFVACLKAMRGKMLQKKREGEIE